MHLIKKGKREDSSGKIENPGRTFFLRIFDDSVRKINQQRDSGGVSYARKAMIITGMALNTNDLWEESQLTPDLQNIVICTVSTPMERPLIEPNWFSP